MRAAIAGIAVLVLGVVVGLVAAQMHFGARLADADARIASLVAENDDLVRARGRTSGESDALRGELEALRAERDAAGRQFDSAEQVTSPEEASLALTDLASSDAAGTSAMEQTEPADGDGTSAEEEERQRRQERMREFMGSIRERTGDFLASQVEQTNDPAVKQRLAAIAENVNYLMEAGQAMRHAETDEERDALREQFGQARDQLQSLVKEQQNDVLRDMASSYGITDPAKQDAFISSYGELRENPFFSSPMLSGFGGYGGGPGGYRGRGRGGPR